MNFAFRDRGKRILAVEINQNVLDEMRRERKIVMVLQDKNVDEYIGMDITEIDINDKESWKNSSLEVQLTVMDKLDFRAEMAQKVSITRLDYMLKVIRAVLGKGIITDPDAFKDKLKAMVRAERALGMKRIKSSSSFRSLFSKSQRSGGLTGTNSGSGSERDANEDNADLDDEEANVDKFKTDPVIKGIDQFFIDISNSIETKASENAKNLTNYYRMKIKADEDDVKKDETTSDKFNFN